MMPTRPPRSTLASSVTSLPCSSTIPAMREPMTVFARTALAFRWSRRNPKAALSARFSRKVVLQVCPAVKAVPEEEASLR